MRRNQIAIVGAAETTELGVIPDCRRSSCMPTPRSTRWPMPA